MAIGCAHWCHWFCSLIPLVPLVLLIEPIGFALKANGCKPQNQWEPMGLINKTNGPTM